MNYMNLKYCLFIVLCGLMTACKTPKDVVYLQGIDKLTPEQLNAVEQSYVIRIMKDDLLSISVSAWDPAAVTPFNPPVYAYATTQGEQPVTPSETLYTYLVDQEGNINFPVLGKIHVLGLTRLELADKLEIIRAMAEFSGFSLQDIIEESDRKKEKNGGFQKRLLLEKVIE